MVLLVLDDDPLVLQAIKTGLGEPYRLILTSSYAQAVSALDTEDFDGAIIDINLGINQPSGIDFLVEFKKRFPEKPVLIESGDRDLATVIRCIKFGADDYVEKPYDASTLQLKVSKLFSDSRKTSVLKRAFEKSKAVHSVVGEHESIAKAKRMVEQAGPMRILFYGETGVGKTPFAWYSNQVVGQADGTVRPFEQINCACLNAEQFQDQLFGHKKGAFTGAISDKKGLVELADGGDIFLDEIGDMPLDVQAHFLIFLDSGEYYRLGDDKKRRARVRVLSATNRNLKKMVEEGTFRKDLYSRISQVVIEISPLRDRASDIPELIHHFVDRFAGFPKRLSPELMNVLKEYRWEEGNVRELRDAVEFLCISGRNSDTLQLEHLSDNYKPMPRGNGSSVPLGEMTDSVFDTVKKEGLDYYLNHIEKDFLNAYLARSSEDLDEILNELRLSRATFYRRLKKYDIPSAKRWE